MTKIDTGKIKDRFSDDMGNHDEEIHKLCDAYDAQAKEIEYLTKVAKKAEEMAKFYSESAPNTACPSIYDDDSDYEYLDDAGACNCKLGHYRAKEFLSFLEKGDE